MGNSPKSRGNRRERREWIPKGRYPPNHFRLAEEAMWEGQDYSDVVRALYEEEYWFAVELQPARHGSYNAYNNWYCRCVLCRYANAVKVAEGRASVKSTDAANERAADL